MPRVVGPGRRERAYQAEIAALGRRGADLSGQLHRVLGELDTAQLVERGTARFTDRLEERLQQAHAQQARALVLVGSLQQELSQVRVQLDQARSQLTRLEGARPPLLQRLWAALLPGRG